MSDPRFFKIKHRGDHIDSVREISGEEYVAHQAAPAVGCFLLGIVAIIFFPIYGLYKLIKHHPKIGWPVTGTLAFIILFFSVLLPNYYFFLGNGLHVDPYVNNGTYVYNLSWSNFEAGNQRAVYLLIYTPNSARTGWDHDIVKLPAGTTSYQADALFHDEKCFRLRHEDQDWGPMNCRTWS
jgi:hypothetical protein